MKKICYLLLMIVCLSCTKETERTSLLPFFDNAYWKNVGNDVDTLLGRGREIPLELTDQSLIGTIHKIVKNNNFYYILSSNNIYQFDKQGKFISVLSQQGQGPEEYIYISDFIVSEINGRAEIWLSDHNRINVYVFEEEWVFSHSISFPFIIHKFIKLPDDKHIFY